MTVTRTLDLTTTQIGGKLIASLRRQTWTTPETRSSTAAPDSRSMMPKPGETRAVAQSGPASTRSTSALSAAVLEALRGDLADVLPSIDDAYDDDSIPPPPPTVILSRPTPKAPEPPQTRLSICRSTQSPAPAPPSPAYPDLTNTQVLGPQQVRFLSAYYHTPTAPMAWVNPALAHCRARR